MAVLLSTVLLLQDGAIEQDVRALSHEDIAIREGATARLKKTPLNQLHLIEPHLKHADPEVRSRVRHIMHQIISSHLGLGKSRFVMRPVATPEVMKAWIDQGADRTKPPRNHEAVRWACDMSKLGDPYAIYKRDWILLEPAALTEDAVSAASIEKSPRAEGAWQVRFSLNEVGAKKFDDVASTLSKRDPRGMLAMVVDGVILVAPIVESERYDGEGTINGRFTDAEARNFATILNGKWLESSFRAERDRKDAAAARQVIERLRLIQGLAKVGMKEHETGLEITGLINLKNLDLVEIWQSLRDQGYRITPRK